MVYGARHAPIGLVPPYRHLVGRAAADVDEFYATRAKPEAAASDVLVISADGKGIVMRPDALRPATAKAAATETNKLECRLSKGEKRNRKRLAEVGAVYALTPVARTPVAILAPKAGEAPPPAPEAKAKWVTANVAQDAAAVIGKVFDEAERRDPCHCRQWVALVDGNNHQIESTYGAPCGLSLLRATPPPRPG